MRHASFEDLVSSGVMLAILLVLLLGHVAARATHTIVTTAIQHPESRSLRIALLLSLAVLLLTVVTLGNPAVLTLAAGTLTGTWATARVVQLTNDRLLQRPWSLTEDVLHPATWWDAA